MVASNICITLGRKCDALLALVLRSEHGTTHSRDLPCLGDRALSPVGENWKGLVAECGEFYVRQWKEVGGCGLFLWTRYIVGDCEKEAWAWKQRSQQGVVPLIVHYTSLFGTTGMGLRCLGPIWVLVTGGALFPGTPVYTRMRVAALAVIESAWIRARRYI